jgi:hypothetical protein
MQEPSVIIKQKQNAKLATNVYDYYVERSGYVSSEACLATKNPAIIPPFQSRVALTENL